MRNASCSTASNRLETACIPIARRALIGNVRVAGSSAFKGEHSHHVVECGLIAVVPIGALRRVRVEVPLIDVRVRGFIVEPLANAVAALTEERSAIFLKHDLTTPTLFFLVPRLHS